MVVVFVVRGKSIMVSTLKLSRTPLSPFGPTKAEMWSLSPWVAITYSNLPSVTYWFKYLVMVLALSLVDPASIKMSVSPALM